RAARPQPERSNASAASRVATKPPTCRPRDAAPSPVKYPPRANPNEATPSKSSSPAHIATATHQAHRCPNQRPPATASGIPARIQTGGTQDGRSIPALTSPPRTPHTKTAVFATSNRAAMRSVVIRDLPRADLTPERLQREIEAALAVGAGAREPD